MLSVPTLKNYKGQYKGQYMSTGQAFSSKWHLAPKKTRPPGQLLHRVQY